MSALLSSADERSRRSLVSIVVPMLNEEQGVGQLCERLERVLSSLEVDWEIVLVDDGSTDGTRDVVRRLNQEEPRIRLVGFSRNFGKEIAVAAGLRYAKGDAVILMDADLQHPPELLSEFIAKWRSGYQVVYGQRLDRRHEGRLRRWLSHAFYRSYKLLSRTELPPGAGDFRLLDRKAVDALNRIGERVRFNKGLFTWIGFRTIGVPYQVSERSFGKSRFRPRQLLRFALDGITTFSTMPLRIWSYLGIAISLFAFIYAVTLLVKTLIFGTDVPGFPTLVVSVLFLGGVQLISLGVIGEYLGRVYEEVKGRPLFLVSEEIGFEDERGPQSAPRPVQLAERPR